MVLVPLFGVLITVTFVAEAEAVGVALAEAVGVADEAAWATG